MESESKYCTLYIVRHGKSQANRDEIIAGITDSALTEEGQEQARKRAEDFMHIKFDAVFSSDLMRAQKTAEIISMGTELAVNTKVILRERNFGPFEGKTVEEYMAANRELLEKLNTLTEKEKRAFKVHPEYESNDEIAMRMLIFLREISVTYLGKNVLVVSHGSIMRSFLMHIGFATFDQLTAGDIDNLAYVKLESDGVDFFVKETKGINKKN